MALTPGTRLGAYEVLAKLGEGGMGEVYRARDTKLNRDVALKILPEALNADSDRIARFHREAQVLASLNHTNIAHIYGFEDSGHTHAIVLELVEGPTLAERVANGQIPLDEATAIARQIVDALEAAHEQGIVHRDLKPANIKVRSDGAVKVLDFGLAKLRDSESSSAPAFNADVTHSPTITSPAMTRAGVILGTAAYMSPEQAKGRPADKRSDIWAFGCVLFEMLTGRPAFSGETVTEILAGVIHKEPPWDALPADTPVRVRQLLQRCLTKDPMRRLRDIGDARFELDDMSRGAPERPLGSRASAGTPSLWTAVAFAAGAAIAGALAWLMPGRASTVAAPIARWTISLPVETPIDLRGPWSSLAISRDGRSIAYVAHTSEGRELFLRRADDLTPSRIRGTTDVWEAFFSPDGQWIGFIAADRVKKVAITGGQPVTLADAPNFGSGVWADDGTIYLGGRAGLAKLSADGKLTSLVKPEANENALTEPDLLPDGSLLFTIEPDDVTSYDDARIAVMTKDGQRHVVLEGGAYARYSPTGHVLYARGGQIMAVPFDMGRLAATGTPTAVVAGGLFDPNTGKAYFALSRTGTLAYATGGPLIKHTSLAWLDRHGTTTPIPVPARFYAEPAFSPDGRQIALTFRAANDDVWTYDVARGAFTRLTFAHGNNEVALWSLDGSRVVYGADRQGVRGLMARQADGSGGEESLTPAEYFQTPGSWSPDGKVLAYTLDRPDTGSDIMLLPLTGDRKPIPFLTTPVHEREPAFSPDGHWIAYSSNETGQFEVFVTPYPGPGRKWQVSQGGGVRPAWRRDGGEIVYQNGDRVMSAAIDAHASAWRAAAPRELVKLPPAIDYCVMAPDGERFLLVSGQGQEQSLGELNVVLNWMEELKSRVPAK